MGEVVPFPIKNNNQESKGQLDAHFESELEAADAVTKEVVRTRSWFEKKYPHLFLSPGDIIIFLEEERKEIANVLESKEVA